MPTFPTLAISASITSLEDSMAYDPTIRSRSQGGYLKTRAGCTRIPKMKKRSYIGLTVTEKVAFESFEASTGVGADTFIWLDETTSPATSYTMRLMQPIVYTLIGETTNLWRADLVMEEI